MRKFEVELRKTVYITYHDVEALDEDDAEEKALERALEDYGSSRGDDYEVSDVSEEKEVSHG